MDWHRRYAQQASWTREIRQYLLHKAGQDAARRILEVGCGTGAILQDLLLNAASLAGGGAAIHGMDLSDDAIEESRQHAPSAHLCRADAHHLPYAAARFDIACCHFLLMWVDDPLVVLQEMRRVTHRGGFVAAFAEPDYSARTDLPSSLAQLGEMQVASLRERGADPSLGGDLARLFAEAHLKIIETGPIAADPAALHDPEAVASEHEVLRADLDGMLPAPELERLLALDLEARGRRDRIVHIPTYFALAQV